MGKKLGRGGEGGGGGGGGGGGNQAVGEKKMKKVRGKENIFMVFRRSELNSSRTKVGPHNESYVWVPKSKFFVEAQRGKGFLLH